MTSIVQTRDLIKRNVDISKLPGHISANIRAFQQDNHAATQGDILTAYDALDYYLSWQGIIRYTDNIINLFVGVLDAVVPIPASPPVLRIQAGDHVMPPLNLETFYVTYGCGSKLAHKYSVVQAPDYITARRTVNNVTGGEFGFIYDTQEFKGQIERHNLEEVILQPQGPCE